MVHSKRSTAAPSALVAWKTLIPHSKMWKAALSQTRAGNDAAFAAALSCIQPGCCSTACEALCPPPPTPAPALSHPALSSPLPPFTSLHPSAHTLANRTFLVLTKSECSHFALFAIHTESTRREDPRSRGVEDGGPKDPILTN